MSLPNFTLPNNVVIYGSSAEGVDNCNGANAISGSVTLESSKVAIDVQTDTCCRPMPGTMSRGYCDDVLGG